MMMVLYQRSPSAGTLSYMTIALGIGLIVDVYVYLTYSQAFFILHDFPDRSAKEILATSRHLMKGNKFRLFYLNVSFIPLYLLGAVAMFVPILWISVYRYASTCAFYQDLIANAASDQSSQQSVSEQF